MLQSLSKFISASVTAAGPILCLLPSKRCLYMMASLRNRWREAAAEPETTAAVQGLEGGPLLFRGHGLLLCSPDRSAGYGLCPRAAWAVS